MLNRLGMTAGTAQARMRALPLATLDPIAPGTALVLAPHADDESLGCGGMIAMLSACGRSPLIVGVTDGVGSHPSSPSYPPARLRAVREEEMRAAAGILGVAAERVHFLGLPDTRAPLAGPEFDAAVARVVSLVRAHGVETVFASWEHDPHCDHEATARLATAIAAATGVRLLFYPVWGWLLPAEQVLPIETIAGMRLDVTAMLPRKRAAIAAHRSQYSDLITDDPNGFRLPDALLATFEQPFETFIAP
jgi:LmbE family N-acetylglucosaminyl deacetylase